MVRPNEENANSVRSNTPFLARCAGPSVSPCYAVKPTPKPSREEVCQRGAARTVCHAILTPIVVSAPGPLAPAPKMSNKKLEEKYARASKPPPPTSAQRHPDPPSPNTSPPSTAHPPPTPPAPDLSTAIKHQTLTPTPILVLTLILNVQVQQDPQG